jgi:hypothetical protein
VCGAPVDAQPGVVCGAAGLSAARCGTSAHSIRQNDAEARSELINAWARGLL